MDHRILEGFHDIVATLEDHLKPLVDAELSVLVDILYWPELLFPPNTEARQKCEDGGFISRYESLGSSLLLFASAFVGYDLRYFRLLSAPDENVSIVYY